MSNKLQEKIISEIKTLHANADKLQDTAKDNILDTINARINVAELVAIAKAKHGHHIGRWWVDNDMPKDWLHRYITIHKTASRAELMDKNQLRLIGILPEPDSERATPEVKRSNPMQWVKSAAKLPSIIDVYRMDTYEQTVALGQLKPIVDIYNVLIEMKANEVR